MKLIDTSTPFAGVSKAGPGYVEHAFAGTWDIPDGDNSALMGLKQAHQSARDGWLAIYNVNQRLMQNATATPLANLQRSANHASQRIGAVKKSAALAVEVAVVNLHLIKGELNKHVNPPNETAADAAVASEIRGHVKTIKDPEERERFIDAAFDAGDMRTVRAIVGAPHYLSGTIPMTHDRWRDNFLRAAAPGLVDARDNLQKGIELAETAARSIETHAREVIDFAKASDLNALAKELEGAA